MKALLDTSVLVAAFYEHDARHEPSFETLVRHGKDDTCCSVHSLAEVYATLTGMPGPKRVSPDEALLFIDDLRANLALIALDEDEYFQVVQSAAEEGLVGGAVYDAIIGHCALKAKAETICTWNEKDFVRLSGPIAERVRRPQ